MFPKISSVSSRFVLREAVYQSKTVARLKSKYVIPPKVLGRLGHWTKRYYSCITHSEKVVAKKNCITHSEKVVL